MLQFITHPSDRYSIPEEVQMAIEGGCRWIQLRIKEASDEEVREIATEIMPMCQETGTILVLNDRVQLANELRVHGVHLGKTDMNPVEARELLGPHAIIGVTANTAEDIISLRGKDVDYVGLGPYKYTTTKSKLSPILGIEGYKAIIKAKKEAGIELPVVAIGGITLEDVPDLMSTGINGIAVSGSIINADDPAEYTERLIACLNSSI
ncbi:MAG: thiamine phosphate synthase [Pseudoflavonifractor sp.]|nr:thiamine phosphate synthase [Pseudoflavonifractor sp.]